MCSSSSISHFAANRDAERASSARPRRARARSAAGSPPARGARPAAARSAGLRRQQQRLDELAGGDVVREHPLQVVLRVRARRPARTRAAANGALTETLSTLVSLGSVPCSDRKPRRRSPRPATTRRGCRPGQYLTEKWPVLHAGSVPTIDLATWTSASSARSSSRARRSPGSSCSSCRAPSSRTTSTASRAGAASTRASRASTGASSRSSSAPKPERALRRRPRRAGLHANVPLAAIEDEHALVAYEADGEPLTPDHGWPLRLVVPSRYFWKSAKWLRGIELLDRRRARLLGALRLPQRRRLLARSSATASSRQPRAARARPPGARAASAGTTRRPRSPRSSPARRSRRGARAASDSG